MAESERPTYAVCPRIEQGRSTRIPKLFTTESAAKRFLKEEIPRGSVQVEAQVTGFTIAQVRAHRAELNSKLRTDRKEAAEKIKRGQLEPVNYPVHLLPVLNRDKGWQEPVPVCRAADYHGPKCNRTLREFLPAQSFTGASGLEVQTELERVLEDRTADYTCYLDRDWRFDEIEADAKRRAGHEFAGRQHGSIGEILVRAIHDLEAAFQKLHPDAPCAGVADFWRSWQIQRHIADFCFDGPEEADRARVHVYRQLAAFAHELSDGSVPSSLQSTKTYKTPLGRNIERFRNECGWSYDELAEKTGIEKSLIWNHVNKSKGVIPRNKKIYADTFTKWLGYPVSVADLEK